MPIGHSPVTDLDMRKRGYLLASEAARKLKVAHTTVYRWIENDKTGVEGFRDGFRRYVRWSSVLRYRGKDACEALGLSQESIWEFTPEVEE